MGLRKTDETIGTLSSSGTLDAVAPFDFRKSLNFLQGFGPMTGEQRVDEGDDDGQGNPRLTKAIMVDGQTVVFRVRDSNRGGGGTTAVKSRRQQEEEESGFGPSSSPGVDYELFSARGNLPNSLSKSVTERISFFLSLKDDLRPFYSLAQENDPKFYPLVERFWGLHHVKFLTLLEISCWAIMTQRVQRPIALRMKRALVERYGGSLEVDGATHWAFPDYSRLKDVTPRGLFTVTKNQRTAERLDALLLAFGAGEVDESFLRTAPYEKAEERLRRVHGIGEWSAQFIMYRGLGRIKNFESTYQRKRMLKMVADVYGIRDEKEASSMLDEMNRKYGEWSGYWSLYLWANNMKA